MIPTGRHRIRDFATDLDFASRFLLAQVRPPFGIVWSDLDKGTGLVAMAGLVQGEGVMRVFRLTSQVAPRSTPITDTESVVDMNGRVLDVKAAGQVSLSNPEPEAAHSGAEIRAAFSFVAKAMPGWSVAWCREGVTWPVAILTRNLPNGRRWLFVHMHDQGQAGIRALVDLSLGTDEIMRSLRPTGAVGRTA